MGKTVKSCMKRAQLAMNAHVLLGSNMARNDWQSDDIISGKHNGANLGRTSAPAKPTTMYKVPTVTYAMPRSQSRVLGFECRIIG